MTPGRPPPTIVRRTAWEFAGLIVANSGDSSDSRRTQEEGPGWTWPLFLNTLYGTTLELRWDTKARRLAGFGNLDPASRIW